MNFTEEEKPDAAVEGHMPPEGDNNIWKQGKRWGTCFYGRSSICYCLLSLVLCKERKREWREWCSHALQPGTVAPSIRCSESEKAALHCMVYIKNVYYGMQTDNTKDMCGM